jgi:twitching motility protein PilT
LIAGHGSPNGDGVTRSIHGVVQLGGGSVQGNETNMGTALVDKLLAACIQQGASDLHLSPGEPPMLGIHGRRRPLTGDRLTAADLETVVDDITPRDCKRQLQCSGSTAFRFGFGELARVHVRVGSHEGNTSVELLFS